MIDDHIDYPEVVTKIQGGFPDNLIEKREKRILEAISWQGGETIEKAIAINITELPNGMEVWFRKPGKEWPEKPHDMTPKVGQNKRDLSFDRIWTDICSISMIDKQCFKAFLAILYRNSYMLDHVETEPGKIRYEPSKEILSVIDKINAKVSSTLYYNDLLAFIYFLDVLGWNEDIKYHSVNGRPTLREKDSTKKKHGSMNTIASCISVPCLVSQFVKTILDQGKTYDEVDFMPIMGIAQTLIRSKGIVRWKNNDQVVEWLYPYIFKTNQTHISL